LFASGTRSFLLDVRHAMADVLDLFRVVEEELNDLFGQPLGHV